LIKLISSHCECNGKVSQLVSDRLTKSEIESLRLRKKHISDYAQKELIERIKETLQLQAMGRK